MTANKHPSTRRFMLDERDISLARQHNDNISIPARYTSIPQAVEMVETFINTTGRTNRVKSPVRQFYLY
jgi:ribose 5-phosphate isomerase B